MSEKQVKEWYNDHYRGLLEIIEITETINNSFYVKVKVSVKHLDVAISGYAGKNRISGVNIFKRTIDFVHYSL